MPWTNSETHVAYIKIFSKSILSSLYAFGRDRVDASKAESLARELFPDNEFPNAVDWGQIAEAHNSGR